MTKEDFAQLKELHELLDKRFESQMEINRFAKKLFILFIFVLPITVGLGIYLGKMK